MKKGCSKQKYDELRRKFQGKMPEGFVIRTLAYNPEFDHLYGLAQHFIKSELIFFQSDKEELYRFEESALNVLIDMYFNERDACPECNKGQEDNAIEVQ